jgi:DNA-binding LacI/PurR family transcriptional regulator
LHLAGRRVPDDVSLIGFDDLPEARFLNPPLTTVRTDFDDLGRKCFEVLSTAIEGEGFPPVTIHLTPELIVRESTSAVRR